VTGVNKSCTQVLKHSRSCARIASEYTIQPILQYYIVRTSLSNDAPTAATTAAAAAMDKAQALHSARFTALQHELAVLDSTAAAASPNCWSQSLAAIACRLQFAATEAAVALTNSGSSVDSGSCSAGKASGPGQHCDWIHAMAGVELCQDNTGKLHVPYTVWHTTSTSFKR
jgi:hypothetical protein